MRWRRVGLYISVLVILSLICSILIPVLWLQFFDAGRSSNGNQSPLFPMSAYVLRNRVESELNQMLKKHCNRPELIKQLAKSSEEGRFPGMEDYELSLVQVVTRHGDRAPIYDDSLSSAHEFRCPRGREYYSVNHSDVKTSCSRATLTLTGCRQHQTIGRHFRDVYKLYSKDIKSKILIVSTAYQRTTRSALCLVSGLLGHTGFDRVIKSASVMFQDSPIRNTQYPKTYRNRDKLWGLVHNEKKFQIAREKWERVRSEVNNIIVGLGWSSVQDIIHLFDAVLCHYCHLYIEGHHSMTPCTGRNCVPLAAVIEIIHAADLATKYNYNTKISVVLAQPLLALIVGEMEDWIKGSMTNRFILYSGHDSTITAVLSALDAFDGHRPPYASRLVFELWQAKGQKNQHLVRVLYNGRVVQSSLIDRLMPFDLFRERLLYGHLRDRTSYQNVCLRGSW